MSSDIKQWLLDNSDSMRAGLGFKHIPHRLKEAADCIEALEAEVASLSMHLDGARGVLKETEARAERLRVALGAVSGHITNACICMAAGGTKASATDILNRASDIARKALEAK